ncbi:MAG: VCBS repeat-containing protein, partial [Nitrospirae bacterium]|nr:VCBS repeat-containing protein [Nitrospirota bacterium]
KGENPVYAVRDGVLSYFKPFEGRITGSDNGPFRVNLGKNHGIKQGMRFTVFREGEPFYHPVTKELIGKTEKFIGRLQIKEVLEDSSIAIAVSGTPLNGDKIRITSSRIKLAFFQEKDADWALSEVFYNSLKESRRFDILESYVRSYDPKDLSSVAKSLGAEAFLIFSTPSSKETMSIKAKLFWVEDTRVFAELESVVGPAIAKELKTKEEIPFLSSAKGEPWRSHEISGGRLIAMGDVDGNGKKELVISDGKDIRIYTYEDELKEIWHVKGVASEEHLSIDILDLNGNGRAEIFVTSLRGGATILREDDTTPRGDATMNSYVLEYDPAEGYRKLWDKAPYFFRVMGESLLMQEFSKYDAFFGPVYKGIWENGAYKPGKPIDLPAKIDIYGFVYVDWQGKGKPQVLALDDDGYLNLYDRGGRIWRSKETYGGYEIFFERQTMRVEQPIKKWYVKGRIITVKTERGQEAIVVKNIPFISMMRGFGYKGAEVYSLWWDGGIMDESLILRGIDGMVTDCWVEGGALFLASKPGFLSKASKVLHGDAFASRTLYYYRLSGK